MDEAVALGREAEAAALAVDRRLTNTEGATVAWNESEFVYANSHGFAGGYRSTRHHIDCAVIGDPGDGGVMQRDYWYTTGRGASDLRPASEVGRIAGERTVRRLAARKLGTLECPVLFEAPEAADLIGSFVGAVSGGALYRKSSFLLDSLGKPVFSTNVSIREDPHIPRARGSAPFDNEGVATAPRDVVRDGVVRGYFLGSYSARKLGMVTTGNAGGSHNLVVAHGDDDLPALHAQDGPWALRHRAARPRRQPGDRRLLAWRRRLLDRGRRDCVPGRGDHDRGQPQGHLSRHRRDRPRCRSPRVAAHRFHPGRTDDGRRAL